MGFPAAYSSRRILPQNGRAERLISGLNPPQAVIFRSNHASNALALAGNLPKDKEKLLLQLREAMAGQRALRPYFMRGL